MNKKALVLLIVFAALTLSGLLLYVQLKSIDYTEPTIVPINKVTVTNQETNRNSVVVDKFILQEAIAEFDNVNLPSNVQINVSEVEVVNLGRIVKANEQDNLVGYQVNFDKSIIEIQVNKDYLDEPTLDNTITLAILSMLTEDGLPNAENAKKIDKLLIAYPDIVRIE